MKGWMDNCGYTNISLDTIEFSCDLEKEIYKMVTLVGKWRDVGSIDTGFLFLLPSVQNSMWFAPRVNHSGSFLF